MGLSFTSSTESYTASDKWRQNSLEKNILFAWHLSKNLSFNSKDKIKVLQNKSNLEGNGWLPYQLRYVWKAIFRVMCVDKLVLDNLDRHLWAGHHGHQDMCCRTSWNGDEDFDKAWLLACPSNRMVVCDCSREVFGPLATESHCPYQVTGGWYGSGAPQIPGIHGQVPWSVIEPPGGGWRMPRMVTDECLESLFIR